MEETSSPLSGAITKGVDSALAKFITEPTVSEARNAIYAAVVEMMEVECHRLVGDHLKVDYQDGKAVVTFGEPLAHVLSDLFGSKPIMQFGESVYKVGLPKWKEPTETEVIQATRPYIDPRTRRPTRGRPTF
jgi:hypothetical protein